MAVIMFNGCNKVIDLDIKEATPRYVIEGYVSNEQTGWKVYVSQTQNFQETGSFKGVSGATVSITGNGKVVMLHEMAPGFYQSKLQQGLPGQTYHLTVRIDNDVFTASSRMPQMAEFLELKLKPEFTSAENTVVTAVYQDVLARKDFYWFERSINNVKLGGYVVYNDEFIEGMKVSTDFTFKNEPNNGSYVISSGDRIRVDMHCIDPLVYGYFFSLYNANGSALNGLAPSNPASNISGGALGVFSAHTHQSKTIIVP